MSGCAPDLRAPFPWFGGKSRAAAAIWERLGNVVNYVEPFAGSLAVLLARPAPGRIETVNDRDAYLANFWRACQSAPDEVARWADGPVNEADLHARHVWLLQQTEHRERMLREPDYFDARIAGWWIWGLCAWIGSGWCDVTRASAPSRQLPFIGGQITQAGMGIHAAGFREPSRQLPHLAGGSGTHPGAGAGLHSVTVRTRIAEVFQALAERLRYTRVACGDWRRVLTDSVTWRHGTTGIVLDAPYPDGTQGLYGDEGDEHPWPASATWAAEHGDDKRLRIALCGYTGTWAPPPGWTEHEWKARGGYGGQSDAGDNVNAYRERIWFSPGCVKVEERQLSIDALIQRGAA